MVDLLRSSIGYSENIYFLIPHHKMYYNQLRYLLTQNKPKFVPGIHWSKPSNTMSNKTENYQVLIDRTVRGILRPC